MTEFPGPATDRQLKFLEVIRKRLHLGTGMFAAWVQNRYGVEVAKLDKAQASDAIDYLEKWVDTPPEFLEAAGQTRLM